MLPALDVPGTENELKIRGCADASVQHYYDEGDSDLGKSTPCAVCGRRFNQESVLRAFRWCQPHSRSKTRAKRKAEWENNIDAEQGGERITKWIRKDIGRHD
jgi:hypothetical protein